MLGKDKLKIRKQHSCFSQEENKMEYKSKLLERVAKHLQVLKMKFSYDNENNCLVLEEQPFVIIDYENPMTSYQDKEILVAFIHGKVYTLDSKDGKKVVIFVYCKDCNKNYIQLVDSTDSELICPYCKKSSDYSIIGTERIPFWNAKKETKKEAEYSEDSLLDESLIESHLDLYSDTSRELMEKVFNKLKGSPKYLVADEEKIEKIKALETVYPNMKEVIDYIVLNLKASALRCHRDISFRPIVLVGGPGCGKSSFCSDLCKIVMGKPPVKIDLGNNVANFSLSGSAPEFKQARHGLIIESMFSEGDNHPLKNPIIQFDELDKIKKEDSFSIESIFYSILEKANSKRFYDNYIGMNIDASGINYIFTANSLDNISSPIINRLKIFKIEDYTHEQLKDCVLSNLYKNWIENEKMEREYLPSLLSDEIKERILRYSNDDPRSIEDSIIRVLNETLIYDTESDHPIALFSQEELELGWKNFRGKKRATPKKKKEDKQFDPVKFLEQYITF